MVIYICEKCGKEFTKKSNFNSHCNKIRPCNDENVDIIDINKGLINTELKFCQNLANEAEVLPKNDKTLALKKKNKEINNNIIKEIKEKLYLCNYCEKTFTQIGGLKRHLLERCKIRKEGLKQQETTQNNNNDNNILKIVSELKEENNELKKMIMELAINAKANNTNNGNIKTDNSTNNTNSINNNINNQVNGNITTNNIKIEFGKEDLDKISNDFFIKTLVNYSGAAIPSKIIEGIHFNPEFKEFMNVFISDISRNKAMVFDTSRLLGWCTQ
jgi:hypothetical protein